MPSKGPGKGEKGQGKGKGSQVDKMLEYLKAKPASYFTEVLNDGKQRALCESFILTGKCSHGSECIFGQHGGHPASVTDELKGVCKARKEARAEKNKRWRDHNTQKREYAEVKRRLDAGESP